MDSLEALRRRVEAEVVPAPALALALLLVAGAAAAETPNDVAAGHWAFPAVQRVVAAGVMGLHPGGAFLGKDLVTRLELAHAAARLEELGREGYCKDPPPLPRPAALADLPPDHPKAWAAGMAVRMGYMLTDKEERLRGEDMVSRFTVARLVGTYLDRFTPDLIPLELPALPDVPANHLMAESAARTVAARVLMVGADGDFMGNRLVNRYDLAVSLSKLLVRERATGGAAHRPGCAP